MIVADYISFVNNEFIPLGHGKKVLNEAVDLLAGKVDLICAACREYLINYTGEKIFLNAIVPAFGRQKKKAYIQYLNEMRNIHEIFKKSDGTFIWFTNVDWVLFAYIAIFKPENKMGVTIYRDLGKDLMEANSRFSILKYRLYEKGIGRVKSVIVTNPSLSLKVGQMHLPDYVYSSFYEKYQRIPKKKQIACLGIIRDSKDVKGVIEHFKRSAIHVIIAGIFCDKEVYEYAVANATDNISIRNEKLDDKDYYQLIGSSKYIIMPYKVEACSSCTSGILLETVFCGSIPIAPEVLLKNNKINGISYAKISDIPTNFEELDRLAEDVINPLNCYKKEYIQTKLLKEFDVNNSR